MRLKNSDSISTHEDTARGGCPSCSDGSDYLNGLMISEMRPHVSELGSIEESDNIRCIYSKCCNPFLHKDQLMIYFTANTLTYENSIAPRNESHGESFSLFSTENLSDSINDEIRNLYLTNRLLGTTPQDFLLPSSVTRDYGYVGRTDPATQIKNASHHEEIFNVLGFVGHRKIVARLKYLHEITPDDDPEDPPMKFQSLKECALFFLDNDVTLPCPQIGICSSGLLHVEWRSRSRKVSSSMRFLLDGNARFVGTMAVKDNLRQTIQGTGAKKYALQSILPYIKHATIENAQRSNTPK